MRKLLFFFIIYLCGGIACAFAQEELKIGFHGGLPVGSIEKSSSFKAGGDLTYLFSFVDILEIGPMAGYSHYFIREGIDMPYYYSSQSEDVSFIPLALAGRVTLGENVFLGADAGYALSLVDWTNGGIYYRPKLGYMFYGVAILASYEGINMDEGIISSFNLGVEFQI